MNQTQASARQAMSRLQQNKDWIELKRLFTEHPRETGETYAQHLWFTVQMSVRFVVVSVILMTHGLLPFVWTRTASRRIERIYMIMKDRAQKTNRDLADMYDI